MNISSGNYSISVSNPFMMPSKQEAIGPILIGSFFEQAKIILEIS